jgi:3-oxoacyl-[acyl-carrier-protein] synthase-3
MTMLGIEAIASYVPEGRVSNIDLLERFEISEAFLRDKLGVVRRAIRSPGEETSDLALMAFETLLEKTGVARDEIDALVVVTQNPDSNLPHVSGLVHGRAKLASTCAAFDLSLGCSGYVYGLSVLESFLTSNGLRRGVIITADPYSKIIDPSDKNTVLLFGDAATATMVGPEPVFACGPFVFGSQGDINGALVCRDGVLQMNGREVFNFAATVVPGSIHALLEKSGVSASEVDCYIFHQGSRYIVDTLTRRLGLDERKVRMDIEDTGNTVSSSIPLLLERELDDPVMRLLVLSGFGVGLSWASCICQRIGGEDCGQE